MNPILASEGNLTKLLRDKSITTWNEALEYVKKIPYGRNANRNDFSLVITENKGTCSSKHALLKTIADENNIENVALVIGMYKMNESNTKLGKLLTENSISYIPEAHCYLKINGTVFDVTSTASDFEKIEKDILEEIEIQPGQVADFKVKYHQDYVSQWLSTTYPQRSFEEIWAIREQCIAQLSN